MKKYIQCLSLLVSGMMFFSTPLQAMLEDEEDGSLPPVGLPIAQRFEQMDAADPSDALLLANRAKIEATVRPFIAIKETPVEEDLPLWQSKFGGHPFLPSSIPYPTTEIYNSNRQRETIPMLLVAQLNFSEIPPILEGFPRSGWLQFYSVPELSDMDFKVIYVPHMSTNVPQHDLSNLPEPDENFPFQNIYSLTFKEDSGPIASTTDGRFKTLYESFLGQPAAASYDLEDAYRNCFSPPSTHWIGGYPEFDQNDMRDEDKDILLLHMGSTWGDRRILWGDAGQFNAFISLQDLEALDFSKAQCEYDAS